MDNKDKSMIIKKLLEKGEYDRVILGKAIGYQGSTDSIVRKSFKRFLDRNPDLKELHSNIENKGQVVVKTENNYKNNFLNPVKDMGNLKTLEDLSSMFGDNPVIKIITDEIQKIKTANSNQNNYNSNDTKEMFILSEKYNYIDSDEIIPVSLRISREAKKKLDKYCANNKQHKKIHIVSQMIEEFIEKYE